MKHRGADGDFGDECLNAVKAFQRDKKLTVDGIVGAKTWAAKNKIVEYLDNAQITADVQEV